VANLVLFGMLWQGGVAATLTEWLLG